MRLALTALALIGCGSSTTTPAPDLAVVGDDLAVPADLAIVSDMATKDLDATVFCDHLRAALGGAPATDCAVAYLARLMSCFQTSGACSSTSTANYTDSCWTNGASAEFFHSLGVLGHDYAMNGHRCASILTDTAGPYYAGFCIATAGYDCDSNTGDMAGSGARYVAGTFTCTDGTEIVTGDLFGCAEVKQFLWPACDGTADAGGCAFP